MTISIAIMSTRDNATRARQLADLFDAPVQIAWADEGTIDPAGTSAKAWAMASADHHIVLEDDAHPVPDANPLLSRIAANCAVSSGLVCMFAGRMGAVGQSVRLAGAGGHSYVDLMLPASGRSPATPTVAVMMPRQHAIGYAEFLLAQPGGTAMKRTSALLTRYASENSLVGTATAPCLFEHDVENKGSSRSVLDYTRPLYRASWFNHPFEPDGTVLKLPLGSCLPWIEPYSRLAVVSLLEGRSEGPTLQGQTLSWLAERGLPDSEVLAAIRQVQIPQHWAIPIPQVFAVFVTALAIAALGYWDPHHARLGWDATIWPSVLDCPAGTEIPKHLRGELHGVIQAGLTAGLAHQAYNPTTGPLAGRRDEEN